jgi:hypothetical protein
MQQRSNKMAELRLQSLPDDILKCIFRYIDKKNLLAASEPVNRLSENSFGGRSIVWVCPERLRLHFPSKQAV